MTHRLILTRHAKSSWDDPLMDDADRPLNGRGHASARLLGEWMASRGYVPEQVLCSTALRTKETWAGIAAAMPAQPVITLTEQLYHAEPEQMLSVLRTASRKTVLMLGHNPGIGVFAQMLPATMPIDPGFDHYPTGATLVLEFDIPDWRAATPGAGQLLDFVTPRSLE